MKYKIALFIILLAIGTSVFSQTVPAPVFTKEEYLQRSKNQKTAAWIMLGSGTALAIGGTISALSNGFVDIKLGDGGGLSGGAVMMIMGGMVDVASIPLFVMAGRNEQRARAAFTTQSLFLPQKNATALHVIPAVKLTIGL